MRFAVMATVLPRTHSNLVDSMVGQAADYIANHL